jgi:hypothetical protein
MQEHRDEQLGVVTSCEAVLKNLSVLKRLFVANLHSQLTAEDPRHGAHVRFLFQKPPSIEGMVLEEKPVEVVIDIKDLAETHAHGHYIVKSVVKELVFPKGIPRGVTVVSPHILKVENFGKIYFGELVIGERTRRLTMLRFQLGSDTGGSACCGESKPNGETT